MDINPSLDRIQALSQGLGRPQDHFASVLVAGTNGKGTCAAILDSILRAAGQAVGLYTSPHLIRETERVRVRGREIARPRLDEALAQVDRAANADGVAPSPFERLTAAAFLIFRDEAVDHAVLEVGLGGRWDATCVARSELGLITSIGRDHSAWLGESLEEIAAEKAAIARPDMTVLSAVERSLHDAVVAPVASGLGARVLHLEDSAWWRRDGGGTLAGPAILHSAFPGAHGRRNTALAAWAAEQLGVEPPLITRGVEDARWPGRFETLALDPLLITDVAHNADSFRALLALMRELHPRAPFQILFGVKPDKELARIAPFLAGLGDLIHVFGNEGASGALEPAAARHELADARVIAETLGDHDLRAVSRGGLSALPGVMSALRRDKINLLACGSHQLVGAVMSALSS